MLLFHGNISTAPVQKGHIRSYFAISCDVSAKQKARRAVFRSGFLGTVKGSWQPDKAKRDDVYWHVEYAGACCVGVLAKACFSVSGCTTEPEEPQRKEIP